ncbi:hypothetical protein GCM10010232_41450 [Streptomyces amakusaensis]
MTSIPASRSARAITFAPRSWPSSPGLATTTRIGPVTPITASTHPAPPQVNERYLQHLVPGRFTEDPEGEITQWDMFAMRRIRAGRADAPRGSRFRAAFPVP